MEVSRRLAYRGLRNVPDYEVSMTSNIWLALFMVVVFATVAYWLWKEGQ